MRLPDSWIGIDVLGTTRLDSGIFIHSAGGQRVAKPLRRAAMSLGFDREGEKLFTKVVTDALAGSSKNRSFLIEGKQCYTHWVLAPDGVAVALIVWLADDGLVPPRPIYNSWILDLDRQESTSAGDDLSVIGDGRAVGEARPIRFLLRHSNVGDGASYLAFYWDILTGQRGMLAEVFFSLKPPGAETWTHFWSTTRCGLGPTAREVYGMSVALPYRDLDTRLTNVVAFTDSTLLMLDPDRRITVFASGALADELDEEAIDGIWDQMALSKVTIPKGHTLEKEITVNGVLYQASAFTLPIQQDVEVTPTAVLLKAAEDQAVALS